MRLLNILLLSIVIIPVASYSDSVKHTHNSREHSHPLPSTGLNHNHGSVKSIQEKTKSVVFDGNKAINELNKIEEADSEIKFNRKEIKNIINNELSFYEEVFGMEIFGEPVTKLVNEYGAKEISVHAKAKVSLNMEKYNKLHSVLTKILSRLSIDKFETIYPSFVFEPKTFTIPSISISRKIRSAFSEMRTINKQIKDKKYSYYHLGSFHGNENTIKITSYLIPIKELLIIKNRLVAARISIFFKNKNSGDIKGSRDENVRLTLNSGFGSNIRGNIFLPIINRGPMNRKERGEYRKTEIIFESSRKLNKSELAGITNVYVSGHTPHNKKFSN